MTHVIAKLRLELAQPGSSALPSSEQEVQGKVPDGLSQQFSSVWGSGNCKTATPGGYTMAHSWAHLDEVGRGHPPLLKVLLPVLLLNLQGEA